VSGGEILCSPFNLELSGRLAEATIYFLLGTQLLMLGWRNRNDSLWRYKDRSESKGAIGKGEDKTVCHACESSAQCLHDRTSALPSCVRSSKSETKPSCRSLQMLSSSTFKRQSKRPQPNQRRGESTRPPVIFADPSARALSRRSCSNYSAPPKRRRVATGRRERSAGSLQ